MSRNLPAIAALLAIACSRPLTTSLNASDAVRADLIIVNAKVFTTPGSDADALAIAGDRIVAVGSRSDIEKVMGPATRMLDAHGGSVTPGFNDAHVHFLSGSLALRQVDLSGAETLAAVEQRIGEFIKSHPDQTCIVGRGWLYGTFPDGLPHKALLDKVVSDRPAIMKCYDGHTLWVNSAALRKANITGSTPDPAEGIIVRDPTTGEPTGVLKESAQALIEKIIPEPSTHEKMTAIQEGIAAAHRLGITSVQEAGVGLAELALFESLRKSGELPMRIMFALDGRPRMSAEDAAALDALRRRFPQLNVDAIKLYVDGVIEAHTASMLEPYANRPVQGLPKFNQEELNDTVQLLDRHGWQIMVHAIGDGGIRMTLDAFEQAQNANPTPPRGRRHRLEHIETINQADIGRFARLGIIASMQPYHADPNGNIFNVWAANIGPDRASRAWPWKSIHDAGGRLALGSDWPVVSIDPRLGMHTALTRQTLDGKPPNGFLPQQRLPLRTVVDAYTSGSAFAEFAEDRKGTLAPGMLADVVVWSKDLFSLPVQRIHTAAVSATLFNGRIVYEAAKASGQ